jgi:transcriptional regulator with GAF, ATPase, and Fis domain
MCKQTGYSNRMRCLERRYLVADYATVTSPTGDQGERRFERIIGNSAALESVLDQVEQVAPTDSTVLIEGETGT